MPELPRVSVIVLNYNGQRHLEDCFPSLIEIDYPKDKLELMLVDNASTDRSVAFAEAHFPQVRVIRSPENVGFASGNNLGAREATGQYVLFLNNDMSVDPQFVRELVAAVQSGPDIVSAAAKILNWDGTRIDFAGAGMQYAGHGYQPGYNDPADNGLHNTLISLLFACGGAMLIDRAVFLDTGGFDDDYFIYFEDVDLGWRLWLMGYRVVLAPKAIVFHRHHGTMSKFPDYRKQVLYTRNAVSSVIKNYSDENLAKVLPALLLTAVSGTVNVTVERRKLDKRHFKIKGPPPAQTPIHLNRLEAATLVALNEVADDLPRLMAKRQAVQARRRRADSEILPLFGRPFRFFPYVPPEAQMRVAQALGVQDIFAGLPRRVLVVSPDLLPYPGLPTVGSGLRAWGLGQGLISRGHEVIFSMPRLAANGREADVPPDVLKMAWEPLTLPEVIRAADPDVVVVSGWPIMRFLPAEPLTVPVVLDQHGPHILERSFQKYGKHDHNVAEKLAALRRADFFLCAGEKQLAYFRPWLRRAGWSEAEAETLSAAIPISLSPELPERQPAEELSFVYGGVYLPWQNPSAGLSALDEALRRHDRGRLYLYGGRHPTIPIDPGLFEPLVEKLQQNPRVTVPGLVPHNQLIDRYRRAHVALDVMQRNAERELAFTTRTVEYLWCGLPVIYHDYAELSDYIREYEAGWTVDPEDPEALRRVLDTVFSQPEEVARRGQNARRLVRERLTWDRTIEPLDHLVRYPRFRATTVRRTLLKQGQAPPKPRLLWIAVTVLRMYGPRVLLRDTLAFLKCKLTGRSPVPLPRRR